MAETLLSPGVLARENDQSAITSQPIQAGAAIIGPAVKGPVGIPTLVTSYSEYVNKYGTTFTSASAVYSFLTSISAYNYFNNGGTSLLVTRIDDGNFSNASSSAIYNGVESGVLSTEVDALLASVDSGFNITGSSLTEQTFVSSSNVNVTASFTFATSESLGTVTVTGQGGTFSIGDTISFTSQSLGANQPGGVDLTFTLVADDIVNENALVLKTFSEGIIMNNAGTEDSNGALVSGSNDNIRWEVVNSDTDNGTFSLTIRRGNDITNEKVVLETWTNLSMDPKASNYVSKVIGDSYQTIDTTDTTPYVKTVGNYPNKSRYVYVSSVNSPTPDYFDNSGNAKAAYTASIPIIGSGSFAGASGEVTFGIAGADYYENINSGTNIQGLDQSRYTQSIDILNNQDEYSFNVITAPGLIIGQATSTITKLINMVQERGDAIAVVDPAIYGATLATMTSNASTYNSSYAATYAPWLQTTDPDSGQLVWVPASTMIPGVYAYNDKVGEAWFAPAGLNRGGLATVVRPERKLSQANRDTLYQGKVNPIASFPGAGTVVFGQKTLQTKASALDRVNVRRLLIALKSYISQVSDNLVFEQNTIATRNAFLSQVNPYLESVQQRQGLYAFKVIMDDTNNTADVIDRNQLIGQIYLQPTKTAEFILLDFNVLPTGATFPA